jgi:hypothetical protein
MREAIAGPMDRNSPGAPTGTQNQSVILERILGCVTPGTADAAAGNILTLPGRTS